METHTEVRPFHVDIPEEDLLDLRRRIAAKDNLMPPAINESNAKHYRHTKSVTDY
jgi:hypothetical protein